MQSAMPAMSVKSGGSSNYRTVARNANVDETLFGNPTGGKRVEQEIAIIGKDTVQVSRAVFITLGERGVGCRCRYQ